MQQRSSERPLVSIITIVLNGEVLIEKTIESVLGQSYQNIEYVIIDGGSKDGTVEIIKKYSSQLSYWHSETDNGISDAFNKGIRQAQGEIIGLLNAGDWYEFDAVERIVEAFREAEKTDIVCGSLQFWKGDQREYLCQSVPRLLDADMSVTHPTCFLRAELYRKMGLFSNDYKYAMDYELLLRMKNGGAVFLSLDYTLTNMLHEGISETNWQAALRETHRARCTILKRSFFTTSLYYYFVYMKRRLRFFLERTQFTGFIKFYRNRIALVRKTK